VGQNRGRGGSILTPNELLLPLGVLTSVPMLVKIDQEMRPRECSQTDRQTDTLTDANRFYNLSHAICYSYGTDNDDDNEKSQMKCSRLFDLLQLVQRSFLRAFAGARRALQELVDDAGRVARRLTVLLGAVDTPRRPDVGHVKEMPVT